MIEWKEVFIDEITEIHNKTRKPLNSRQRMEMKGEYPYYGASGIFDYLNDYIFNGQYLLVSEDGENLRSRQTPIAFIVKGKFWVNNHAHILKGKGELMNEYLELYFQYLNIDPWITGAVQPKLNKENLLSIPISMPVDEKERIELTKVLSKLNEKIAILRQQNETLEKMAQTLFKRWFVDFEFPNENGQPYKSSGGKMAESELGEIPEGWSIGQIKDIMTLNYGKALKTEDRISGCFPVIGSSGITGSHESFLVKAPGIVIGRKGTIGRVTWLDDNFYPIDTTYYIGDKLGISSLYFHYFLLKIQNFDRIGSDSAVPGLNRDMAYGLDCIVPNKGTLKKFENVVKSMFDKKRNNAVELEVLTKLRDILLPKLMSGEVRVKTKIN